MHINDPHGLQSKATLICEVNHAFMHRKLVKAIESAVVYYARAVHEFSAGIKCRHCTTSVTGYAL